MLCAIALGLLPQAPAAERPPAVLEAAAHALRIERGEGHVPLLVPRSEELEFDVIIDLGILGDVDVGDVALSSGLERIPRGLPNARGSERRFEMQERTWVRSVATGGYAGYSLREEIESSHLAQDWPRVLYKDTQTGSENRKRELRFGLRDGVLTAEYRSNRHCGGCENREHYVDSVWAWGKPFHCKKCKRAEHRVWRDPVSREVPDGSVDMLSAVYVARSMLELGIPETSFPLVDQQRVWRVTVKQGATARRSVPAGTFECRQVNLTTALEAGEDEDEKESKNFKGLFGLQGTIRIFLDARTGVPVYIQGQLPIPVPLVGDLDISVQLKKHKGTPPGFKPVK